MSLATCPECGGTNIFFESKTEEHECFSCGHRWRKGGKVEKGDIDKLEGLMSRELEEEKGASRKYLEMAAFADSVELPDVAEKLRSIAQDENRHYNILDEILMRITGEKP